ncbi:MAG: response regulator transcription factor [Solirubrobacteraceae bacterium]
MSGHLHLVGGGPERSRPAQPSLPIRIVLADDHVAVRRNLKQLLDREDDITVVAEAADLSTVARHVREHRPDVLVLDLEMPGGSSLETIAQLRRVVPDTGIVVLTMEPSPIFAQQALQTGAVGFVLKDRADDELPEAVRTAAACGEYVSPRIAAGLDALRRGIGGNVLTARETEILRLIALGHTSDEIAGTLHLSRRTVEGHRARIHQKLRTSTRAELVRYALERHLIGT